MRSKGERRGGWSGGPVPDGRHNLRFALGALLVGVAAVGLVCWVALRM